MCDVIQLVCLITADCWTHAVNASSDAHQHAYPQPIVRIAYFGLPLTCFHLGHHRQLSDRLSALSSDLVQVQDHLS